MNAPWPFGPSRYARHLEGEIDYLRGLLAEALGAPDLARRGQRPMAEPKKIEPLPAALVEQAARFDKLGPKVLEEARREHERTGTPYDVLTDRLKRRLEDLATGQPWRPLDAP